MSSAPTFAYVVLCHHKRDQVLRLVRAIRRLSPDARVLVRHDRPAGFIDEEAARAAGADLLVSDTATSWGHWSLVEATLEAFARARALYDPDWLVLVSGQDYPVRPLSSWERELTRSGSDAVVRAAPFVSGPVGWRYREADDDLRTRYTHRWRRLPRIGLTPRLPSTLVRAMRAVWYRRIRPLQALIVLSELPRGGGWALGVRRRAVPFTPDAPAYKGQQWLALSRAAMAVTLDGERARRWQEWYRGALVPDESYFPTLIAAANLRIDSTGLSWTKWPGNTSHPLDIEAEMLEEIRRSGMPFARKFDEATSPGILDLVDRTLLADGSQRH